MRTAPPWDSGYGRYGETTSTVLRDGLRARPMANAMLPRARPGSDGPSARNGGSDSTRVTNSASSYGQSGAAAIAPVVPTLYDRHPADSAFQKINSQADPGTTVLGIPSV